MEREDPAAMFSATLSSDDISAAEYGGVSQRSWAGFEVNTAICRSPCPYHDHGPVVEKPPTWPPALDEELFQCRLCGDVMVADAIDYHMCLYIRNSMEDDDE